MREREKQTVIDRNTETRRGGDTQKETQKEKREERERGREGGRKRGGERWEKAVQTSLQRL